MRKGCTKVDPLTIGVSSLPMASKTTLYCRYLSCGIISPLTDVALFHPAPPLLAHDASSTKGKYPSSHVVFDTLNLLKSNTE